MSVLAAREGEGKNVLLVKGAAECVLERSTRCVLPRVLLVESETAHCIVISVHTHAQLHTLCPSGHL